MTVVSAEAKSLVLSFSGASPPRIQSHFVSNVEWYTSTVHLRKLKQGLDGEFRQYSFFLPQNESILESPI